MECFDPRSIPRPNGKGNKDRITVSCQKCVACLSRRRSIWCVRLEKELSVSRSAQFVTLTLNDSNLTYGSGEDPLLNPTDIILFLKRLRKELSKTNERKIRYFACGEYGDQFGRPHYHMIIFNLPENPLELIKSAWSKDGQSMGFVYLGTVTPQSIAYVAKYAIKSVLDEESGTFARMSRKPGIGYDYALNTFKWHKKGLKNYIPEFGGVKKTMPRYYEQMIYNIKEREILSQRKTQFRDEKELKKYEDLLARGENPFTYKLAEQKMFIEAIKRKLKSNENQNKSFRSLT